MTAVASPDSMDKKATLIRQKHRPQPAPLATKNPGGQFEFVSVYFKEVSHGMGFSKSSAGSGGI